MASASTTDSEPRGRGAGARPRAGRRVHTSVVAGSLVLALAVLAWAMPPAYNWDMLAYAAIALDEGDADVRHQRLWRYVERDVPPAKIALLRAQNPADLSDFRPSDTVQYRRVTAADPAAFAEQLPFYAVKPLYPIAIAAAAGLIDGVSGWLGKPSDVGPVLVSVLIAKFSWMAFGVTVFLLLRLRLSNSSAALATITGMVLPTVHGLSGYSSPDALSAMFIMLGFVLALRDPSRLWTIAAAGAVLLGVAARPENVVLLGLMLTWFLWNSRIRFRWAVVVGMAGVCWCLLLSRLANNYGWAVLLHHSFVDFAEFPSRLKPQLSFSLLFQLYVSKLGASQAFFQFMGLGLFVAAIRLALRGQQDRLAQALCVMLVFMAAHWLIFPDQKDRLMVAPYLFILASGLFVLADYLSVRMRRP